MPKPVQLAIEDIQFYVRNRSLRLPFRYGKACLTAAPLLHLRMQMRDDSGRTAHGVSADMLPPKWFDKDPAKSFRQNVSDLIEAASIGAAVYREVAASPSSPFAIWHSADGLIRNRAAAKGFNGLTSGFAASLGERAMLDAASKLANCPFHELLRQDLVGLEPDRIHPELAGIRLDKVLPAKPLSTIMVRHTVGLADPILDSELPITDREKDAIPVSLESWIREAGVRYFKIKVSNDESVDSARLTALADLFERALPHDYHATLDGNEQFKDVQALETWYDAMSKYPGIRRLLERVLYLEQPIERSAALSASISQASRSLPPMIIDESDDNGNAFRRAVDLGYRGCSVKNCKGVFPAALNAMLVHKLNCDRGEQYVLTSEDLCNQSVVPLQQDLCTLSTLGITHSERNGHHYGGAADHLSEAETKACLEDHSDLYAEHDGHARLRIRDGSLRIASVHRTGYGVDIDTDFDSMVQLKDWDFDTLGVADA